MRSIHTADIHLDSPLRGLSAYQNAPAEHLRGATREAFSQLITRAIDERVNFIVIAGDLYDGGWPAPRPQRWPGLPAAGWSAQAPQRSPKVWPCHAARARTTPAHCASRSAGGVERQCDGGSHLVFSVPGQKVVSALQQSGLDAARAAEPVLHDPAGPQRAGNSPRRSAAHPTRRAGARLRRPIGQPWAQAERSPRRP